LPLPPLLLPLLATPLPLPSTIAMPLPLPWPAPLLLALPSPSPSLLLSTSTTGPSSGKKASHTNESCIHGVGQQSVSKWFGHKSVELRRQSATRQPQESAGTNLEQVKFEDPHVQFRVHAQDGLRKM
jgi:hypothetical protein